MSDRQWTPEQLAKFAAENAPPFQFNRIARVEVRHGPEVEVLGVDLGGKPLEFVSIRFGERPIEDAKTAPEAAQIILTNMFYQTFDDDRVWTNSEWRAAIKEAATTYPAFDSILADERTDWRNDDFADRVIAIRDAGKKD